MKSFIQELKIAVESLRRRIGFVMTVVITLGVTLGALITFFNLNHILLLKPLPYPEQDRLMITQHANIAADGVESIGSPFVPGLLHSYKNQTSFDEMTILSAGTEFMVSHPEQPRLAVTYTTPEYFSLLAAPMQIGRAFSASEGLDSSSPVAIISFDAWHKWFDGRENVIGEKLQVRNTRFTIVGVTDKDFIEPEITAQQSDLWLPWDFNGMNELLLTGWNNGQGNIAGLGKLQQGLLPSQAEVSLTTSMNAAYQAYIMTLTNPNDVSARMAVKLQPLKIRLLGDSRMRGLLLMAAVFGLLIIASTNVVNLFYSRVAEKQRTFAIQAALGARKKHIFTAMFAESLLLTSLSGLTGLLLSLWGIDLVKQLGREQFSRLDELGLDPITFVFTLVLAVVLALVFSGLSSRVVDFEALREKLQSSGKGSGLQISKKSRDILVISQITLASLLLAGAALVLGQAVSVINQPLGYDTSNIRSFSLDVRAGLIPQDEVAQRDQQIVEIVTKLNRLPQIDSVSPTFNTPIGFNMSMGLVDRDNVQRGEFPANFVAANYFDTLQLRIVEGRMFSAEEVRESRQVVVLSQSAAERAGRGQSVVGLQVKVGGGEYKTVIGIVEDVFDPTRRGHYQYRDIYLPHAPWNMHFMLRLKENTELTRTQLIKEIQSVAASLRVANYRHLENRHNRVVRQDKITASVAAALAALALILAGAGIYGVLSYSSHIRRYELGIRMALGAKSKQITNLVITDNMIPIVVGLIISSAVVLMLFVFGRAQIAFFEQVSLLPLVLILPIILCTAFIASYVPVRKVIREDPMRALRNE